MATDTNRIRASVSDYEEDARVSLNKESYTYYARGILSNQTRDDSTNAFKRYRLRPRVMKDVSWIDMSTTVLGYPLKTPIGVSPSSYHTINDHDGEVATISGLHGFSTVMILSAFSNKTVAEVVKAAGDNIVFMNIYFLKTHNLTEHLVRVAERAGCKALVVTVDASGSSYEEQTLPSSCSYMLVTDKYRAVNIDVDLPETRECRRKATKPCLSEYVEGECGGSHATMEDVRWLKSFTKLPIVLKGILTADTARKAASLGVDGILVSSHGGRNLDGVPAPIDALAEVLSAVRGYNVEVYLDGGIRAGADVFKALALGARAVFTARPFQWGLATKGSDGTKDVMHILKKELKLAMELCGCRSLNEITPSLIIHESQYLASKL